MAGADEGAELAFKERSAAAQEQVFARFVGVGTGDFVGPSDAHVVGAVRLPAAHAKADEEVILALVLVDVGAFNRVPVGDGVYIGESSAMRLPVAGSKLRCGA